MRNSPDPFIHRQRERQLIEHVERLLDDERLRIDTTRGRRMIAGLIRDVNRKDRGVELKRLMSEMGKPDRELESRMPIGESIEVILSQKKWGLFKQKVGRLEVVCISPARSLLEDQPPKPLDIREVKKFLTELAAPQGNIPTTLVLLSTSGFTLEAHELADRRADRTLILVEPNDAGGWSVAGPTQTKAMTDLFDPEADEEKRLRLRRQIEESKMDLLTSGIAADRLAAKTQLSTQLIENELKSFARENPGLAARRLDGRLVLFRESAAPIAGGAAGGFDMPLIDRIKTLFSRKGENEKKTAFLAERRAALNQQRDRAYEEMGTLEQQESQLRRQFREASGAITKRRVTSQLLQLRKDIERRQQLLSMLNQQINVVSTHLHNLELVQQGQSAALPDSQEMADDAAAAEEMLARLQADSELADSVGAVAHASMSDEEQALYEELERESGEDSATSIKLDNVEQDESLAPSQEKTAGRTPEHQPPRRTEPEAG